MDNFDQLIKNKIDKTKLPNSDEAWQDFVKYKSQQESTKGGFGISRNIFYSIVSIFVIATLTVSGYYLVQSPKDSISSNVTNEIKSAKTDYSKDILAVKAESKSANQTKYDEPNIASNNATSKIIEAPQKDQKSIQNSISNYQTSTNSNQNTQNSNVDSQGITSTKELKESNSPINKLQLESISLNEQEVETTNNGQTTNSSQSINSKQSVSEISSQSIIAEVSPESTNPSTINTTEPVYESPKASKNQAPQVATIPNGTANQESGNVKKGKRINYQEYLTLFRRYTDVSFYNLENFREISSILNAQFTSNPANSGYENRYSILAGVKSDFFISKLTNTLQNKGTQAYFANAFPLMNNKLGIGIAINNYQSNNLSALNIYLSSAYNIALSKNQYLRLGFGINSHNANEVTSENIKLDYGYTSLSIGARYMYKTLFAELYINNLLSLLNKANVADNFKVPTIYHTNFGGRLFLNKSWALHPGLNLDLSTLDNKLRVCPITSLSYKNRWLMGIQSDNFQSIGIHAGLYANRKFTILIKTDLYSNSIQNYQSGELVLKLELGQKK
jgi:hypothetical protein